MRKPHIPTYSQTHTLRLRAKPALVDSMNHKPHRLFINDVPVETDSPSRFFPGCSNTLRVETDRPSAETLARVELIAPDGRTRPGCLSLAGGSAKTGLGLFCVPAQYEYEAGIMYRRGYRLRVSIEDGSSGAILARYALAAVCSRDPDAEWLMPGAAERCVYNDGYIPENGTWDPFSVSAAAMEPPLQIRLDAAVLVDRNRVAIQFRGRPDPAVGALPARLQIRDAGGNDMIEPARLTAGAEWDEWRPDVADWPEGTYTIELRPTDKDGVSEDGPRLFYRREADDPPRIRVSPFAPFSLRRDETRAEVEITSWPDSLPEGWEAGSFGDETALFCQGDPHAAPVTLDPKLEGPYAVFIRPVNTIHVRVGRNDVVRRVHEPERDDFGDMFTHVADMTGQTIDLYPDDLNRLIDAIGDVENPEQAILDLYEKDGTRSVPFSREAARGEIRSGIRRIRLIPVTEASLREFHEATWNPPFELRAVDDWWCYFLLGHRADPEQLDTIMRGQREVGIRVLNWAVGRSWVQYPSRLPDAKMFPCAPIDHAKKNHHSNAHERILRSCDALGYPLERRKQHGIRLQGWLAMNRHYQARTPDSASSSPWVKAHPEYYQFRKGGISEDYNRVEFYFPEVRRERLDILEEVAAYGPDGIVLGCCRQPPMCAYNPTMVEAYKAETGIDPSTIDIEDGRPYLDWIQWRADFLTDLVRALNERLTALKAKNGKRVPIVARVPDVGFLWNLAQGIDVKTWITEELIDELQLDPLECAAGHASHDVRPYAALCRAHGIPVFGGVNGTTGANRGWVDHTPVAGLRRAIGLLRAGMDGIEIYEAELFAHCHERRWLIPLWGDPDRAERWLTKSNLEAVYPVTARNAALGHDNHWFGGETMHGAREMPRGSKRAL